MTIYVRSGVLRVLTEKCSALKVKRAALVHGGAARLDDADLECTLICMRTTLNLDDALMEEAAEYAGLKEKTALLHEGLRALIQREAAARLAALGGKDPRAAAAPRRKAAARS
jgi:Arc/MetJ family transcription regulator